MTATVLSYQSPTATFAPLRTRTLLVYSALGFTLLAHLGTVVVGLMQARLLDAVSRGVQPTEAEAAANDLRYAAAHLIAVAGTIATAVTVMMWMHRANKNAASWAPRRLQFSPAGTVGWWFCPIANLYKPYQAMREIFADGHAGISVRETSMICGIWWTFWIVGNVIARAGAAASRPALAQQPTLEALTTATYAAMADVPFTLIAGVCLLWIVYSVDQVQAQRRNVVTSPMPGVLV